MRKSGKSHPSDRTACLRPKTGNHVWAERYDRELADIFAVQDEIPLRR